MSSESIVKQAYGEGWSVFPDEVERHIFLLAVGTDSESGVPRHCYHYLLVAKRVRCW